IFGAACRRRGDLHTRRRRQCSINNDKRRAHRVFGVLAGFAISGRRPSDNRSPTRMGKGRDILIPALLEWNQSCIVIDPKGELAAVTGTYRKRFGEVLVLNPFDIWQSYLAGLISARYSPLASLDPDASSFGADADKLADAIVWHE